MINENTAVSLSLVSFIGGVIFFGASLYVNSQHQAAEIERINAIIAATTRDDDRQMVRLQNSITDIGERLALLEGKLSTIEKWCKELIDEKRRKPR